MPKRPTRKAAALTATISGVSNGVTLHKPTEKPTAVAGRIMYIESKGGGLTGPARIGRVSFSKTGKTIYYQGKTFKSLKGAGFKSNYFEVESGEPYWISGPKRNGQDTLYASSIPIPIDENVRENYWSEIRRQPERRKEQFT
jgi:hypothetical protein